MKYALKMVNFLLQMMNSALQIGFSVCYISPDTRMRCAEGDRAVAGGVHFKS